MFVDSDDYRFLHDSLRVSCEKHGCRVHAYVFMTNHIHLLVTPTTASGISAVMQSVGRRYVRRFNDIHGRTGTLWEGRFKSALVDSDRYLFTCCRYIELNPVRAGLALKPDEYRWSSYSANALGRFDDLVTPHERYHALSSDAGARRVAYRALFADGMDDEALMEIRQATNGGWVLGSREFRDEVARHLGRRVSAATRGRRPRSNDEIRL